MSKTDEAIALAEEWGAHNYHPLPVVVESGDGAWVQDVEGRYYLDMLAAYSALNFGHRHPQLLAAAEQQLQKLTLISRAFHNDQLGPFTKELAELCGMDAVLPMNSGAEGVETAIKLARKWAYDVKGVPTNRAKIIVCSNNFHGRTTTIVSFSNDRDSTGGFGPYTPGFEIVEYGNIDALRAAIDDETAAFLIEPVQGEAGVISPPPGYLRQARQLCADQNVLFIADEIQSGLGRTGKTFACDHEDVVPDVYVLGKALAGGFGPLSAVVTRRDIIDVMHPGQHGSTFGGNPFVCAVGREVIAMLKTGELQHNAAERGEQLATGLRGAHLTKVKAIRSAGLWVGIDIEPTKMTSRHACEALLAEGILCKDAHEITVRLSPPLVIGAEDIDWALERLVRVLA